MDYRVIQNVVDSVVAENNGKARIQTAWELAVLFPRYGVCFVYVVLDLIGWNRCHFINELYLSILLFDTNYTLYYLRLHNIHSNPERSMHLK